MAISEPSLKQESTSTFVDLEHVGPGTPAGNWMRQFWHPDEFRWREWAVSAAL